MRSFFRGDQARGATTMSPTGDDRYVSRGGRKLEAALHRFDIDVSDVCCADLGSHVGGFVDCLLQHGAAPVYSVDTCYGTLAWKLRRDPRVHVRERTNAMHVKLPGPVDLVTIDVGWTRQARILDNAAKLITPGARIVTLIKPHYEAPSERLVDGCLPDEAVGEVVADVLDQIDNLGWRVLDTVTSPLRGHGGNQEVFALLDRRPPA